MTNTADLRRVARLARILKRLGVQLDATLRDLYRDEDPIVRGCRSEVERAYHAGRELPAALRDAAQALERAARHAKLSREDERADGIQLKSGFFLPEKGQNE